MAATDSSHAFATASSAMVHGVDSASTLHVLVADCLHLLQADSAGILVRMEADDLEPLVSSSHLATHLETFQDQVQSGPCFDAIKTGQHVEASEASEIRDRWPTFGPTMLEAGFHGVHATPMQWRGEILGGLNLFWHEPVRLTDEQRRTAQAFADVCTLTIMQTPRAEGEELAVRLRAALDGRVVIERAKGVLGQQEGLDMAQAFERLVQLSERSGEPLAVTATALIERTYAR